jgi:hypothetical protein
VYVMSVRFEMRVDDALMDGIDAVRGNETRAAWIKRTLAVALSGGDQEVPTSAVAPSRVEAAQRRAPAIPGVKSAAELFAEQCQSRAEERRRIREGE